MLTISKPLSAGQVRRYHAEEFRNARENYYTEGDRVRGLWYGQLAERWGLVGEVREEQFERLAEGQHPITGEQLVRHHTARETRNPLGEMVTTMEHRAGWDATFSAPKSMSITALVGGDERVREAHRESVRVALKELEPYVQARLGGNHPPETTGNAVASLFEHDSARPVDGYAAPQLHTHAVIFNLTETSDGHVRPLQPRELYRTQQYATAVYRSELAARLTVLGYEIERGRSGQPEIGGYTRATTLTRPAHVVSRSRPTWLTRIDKARRQHKSRRTRRAKASWTSHTRRCRLDIGSSPSVSAVSQRRSLRRPNTPGVRMLWSMIANRLMPQDMPSRTRAIAMWNARRLWKNGRCCGMPLTDHSARRAWTTSSRRSIARLSAANCWMSLRPRARQVERLRRRGCSNLSKRRLIACALARIGMPSW